MVPLRPRGLRPYRHADNRAWWRLSLALCASAFAHSALLALQPGGIAVWPSALLVRTAITVRIAVPPQSPEDAARDAPATPRMLPVRGDSMLDSREGARVPSMVKPAGGGRTNPPRRLEEARAVQNASSLPAAVDTTWYTAKDIDAYPRASAPLRLALPAGAAETATRVLLWLRIDEHGAVVEVSAGEPGVPSAWVEAARAGLASIRFTPARKDERAVKSRLLLSVSFADEP